MKIFSAAVLMRSFGFEGFEASGMKKRMVASFLLMLLRDFFSPRRRQIPENSSAWLKMEISMGMEALLGTSSRLTIVGNLNAAPLCKI